jgi:hypothetical protein
MHLENFNSAIHCHNKAIQYSKQLKSDFSLAIDHGNIGEVYYKLFQKNNSNTDLNKAIHFLSLGYYGCQKIGMSPPQIEFGEKLVEALEKTKKDFHLAFNILKEIEQLKDSIYSKDNSLKIQQLESKYQLNQKESELLLLNLKNKLFIKENIRHMHHKTILILVVIIITLVLTLLYFLFINKSKIYKRRMFEISQFQSHQLRSTAVKISALVEELNSDGISNEEHDKLLTMLTQSATELDLHIHNIVKKAK